MRLILHTCCAPCLLVPYRELSGRGYEITSYFYNPNIHPYREYEKRYATLVELCRDRSWDLRAGTYDMSEFFSRVSGPHPDRCLECFRLRLARTAGFAAEQHIPVFSTTLLVSPYQDQEAISRAGEEAARAYDVEFLFEDFRSGYRDSVEESRRLGLYRQPYCGCVFSEKERYQKSDPPEL